MNLRKTATALGALVLQSSASRLHPRCLVLGTTRGGHASLVAWVYQHPRVAGCTHGPPDQRQRIAG